MSRLSSSRRSSLLVSLFVLFMSLISGMRPTHLREGDLPEEFEPPIWMLVSPRNTPKDIPRIIFNHMSGHCMPPSSWHVKLTINIFSLFWPLYFHSFIFSLAPMFLFPFDKEHHDLLWGTIIQPIMMRPSDFLMIHRHTTCRIHSLLLNIPKNPHLLVHHLKSRMSFKSQMTKSLKSPKSHYVYYLN